MCRAASERTVSLGRSPCCLCKTPENDALEKQHRSALSWTWLLKLFSQKTEYNMYRTQEPIAEAGGGGGGSKAVVTTGTTADGALALHLGLLSRELIVIVLGI